MEESAYGPHKSKRRSVTVGIAAAVLLTGGFGAGSKLLSSGIWPTVGSESGQVPECGAPGFVNAECGSPMREENAAAPGSPEEAAIIADSGNAVQRGYSRVSRRAWQQESTTSALHPGITIMELCAASAGVGPLPCDARSATDVFSPGKPTVGSAREHAPSISGRVLADTGEPLAGVSVVAAVERLDDREPKDIEKLRFWTVTDALGTYSLKGLPAGEYTIRSARLGAYQPARVSARTGVDYADLVMGRNLDVLVEGKIEGRYGEPLEGVTVIPHLFGQPSVQSGPDGSFVLPVSVKANVSSLDVGFRYPGFADRNSKVHIGEFPLRTSEKLRIQMDPVSEWTSLSGVIVDEAGEPLAGRNIELQAQEGRAGQRTSTDESGRFVFDFVESPAAYELLALGDHEFKDVAMDIRVSSHMKELQLIAEAYRAGTVAGRLTNQSGKPIADFELVLRNVESRKSHAVVTTDHLGNFELSAPAGELVISSVSTPSILVQGLHLEPGERVFLPLTLDWGDHTIRGLVVDALGYPVPASRVILDWSHQDDRINTRATRRTATDSQGYFAFSNLGPGPHSLKVDAPGYLGVKFDHDLSREGYDLTVKLN